MESAAPIERRHVTRRTVHAPIVLSDGTFGTTTDVSPVGVRFACQGHVTEGADVIFRMNIDASDIVLHCHGRVVRIEKKGEATYVVASIHNVDFEFQGTSH